MTVIKSPITSVLLSVAVSSEDCYLTNHSIYQSQTPWSSPRTDITSHSIHGGNTSSPSWNTAFTCTSCLSFQHIWSSAFFYLTGYSFSVSFAISIFLIFNWSFFPALSSLVISISWLLKPTMFTTNFHLVQLSALNPRCAYTAVHSSPVGW